MTKASSGRQRNLLSMRGTVRMAAFGGEMRVRPAPTELAIFAEALRPLAFFFQGKVRMEIVRCLKELTVLDESALGLRDLWRLARVECEFLSEGESRLLHFDAINGHCLLTDPKPKVSNRPSRRIGAAPIILMVYQSLVSRAQRLQAKLQRRVRNRTTKRGESRAGKRRLDRSQPEVQSRESVERDLREVVGRTTWEDGYPFEVLVNKAGRVVVCARGASESGMWRYTRWLAGSFMEGRFKPEAVARAVMAAHLRINEKTLIRRLTEAKPNPEVVANVMRCRF